MNVTESLASKEILDLSQKLIDRIKESKGIDCYFNILLKINKSGSVLYYTIDGGGDVIYNLRHTLTYNPRTNYSYPSGDSLYDECIEKVNKLNLETLKKHWDSAVKHFPIPSDNVILNIATQKAYDGDTLLMKVDDECGNTVGARRR